MARDIFLVTFFIFSLSIRSFAGESVPAMFVFGDSQVDVGNNNYLLASIAKANFPHNGIDFPTKKPTGRFSNGKNAADLLAEKVGVPSPPPYLSLKKKRNGSFLNGVSFASGGAGIFNGSDQALGQSITLSKQIDYYISVHKDYLEEKMKPSGVTNHLSKSLFTIVIGSNDLLDYFGSSHLQKKNTPQKYVDLMATKLKLQLKLLYDHGARKFVLAGVTGIGCTPDQRAKSPEEECNEEVNHWAVKYNEALKAKLYELKSKLNGVSYSYFDAYRAMQTVLENPASYGFKEVKAACCGLGKLNAEIPCIPFSKYCPSRRDHMFWDLYHPTEATAHIFVDMWFDGSSSYTYPMNVRQLIIAV